MRDFYDPIKVSGIFGILMFIIVLSLTIPKVALIIIPFFIQLVFEVFGLFVIDSVSWGIVMLPAGYKIFIYVCFFFFTIFQALPLALMNILVIKEDSKYEIGRVNNKYRKIIIKSHPYINHLVWLLLGLIIVPLYLYIIPENTHALLSKALVACFIFIGWITTITVSAMIRKKLSKKDGNAYSDIRLFENIFFVLGLLFLLFIFMFQITISAFKFYY